MEYETRRSKTLRVTEARVRKWCFRFLLGGDQTAKQNSGLKCLGQGEGHVFYFSAGLMRPRGSKGMQFFDDPFDQNLRRRCPGGDPDAFYATQPGFIEFGGPIDQVGTASESRRNFTQAIRIGTVWRVR